MLKNILLCYKLMRISHSVLTEQYSHHSAASWDYPATRTEAMKSCENNCLSESARLLFLFSLVTICWGLTGTPELSGTTMAGAAQVWHHTLPGPDCDHWGSAAMVWEGSHPSLWRSRVAWQDCLGSNTCVLGTAPNNSSDASCFIEVFSELDEQQLLSRQNTQTYCLGIVVAFGRHRSYE